MQTNSNTIDAAISAAGSKATYTGAGYSLWSAVFSSEAGVAAGIIIGILGLIINIVFKRREDKRLAEEHAARMAQLRPVVRYDATPMGGDQ